MKPIRAYFLSALSSVLLLCCTQKKQVQSIDDIVIENDQLLVRISPKGAELQNIIHKKSGREYLWQGDPDIWERRSPVMFPVNVRFKDNRFTYRGKAYEMPRMGLAINAPFEYMVDEKEDRCDLEFRSSEETLRHYPFQFRLIVSYILDGNRLINQFKVENLGPDTMYFALGGHPGFRFPFEQQPNRSAYQYHFSDTMTVSRIEIAESLVQPNTIPFLEQENRLPLNDPRIPENGSGMFLNNVESRIIVLSRAGQEPIVQVDLGDFPNVNLWSPPGRPYACIEPMLSHHDMVDAPLAIESRDN